MHFIRINKVLRTSYVHNFSWSTCNFKCELTFFKWYTISRFIGIDVFWRDLGRLIFYKLYVPLKENLSLNFLSRRNVWFKQPGKFWKILVTFEYILFFVQFYKIRVFDSEPFLKNGVSIRSHAIWEERISDFSLFRQIQILWVAEFFGYVQVFWKVMMIKLSRLIQLLLIGLYRKLIDFDGVPKCWICVALIFPMAIFVYLVFFKRFWRRLFS